MSPYTVTLTESNGVTVAQKEAGITAALAAYNQEFPDASIANEADYVQFVMNRAAESYARQWNTITVSGS